MNLEINRHAKFFHRNLGVLPSSLASMDSTRVMLAYFSVSGLDMLNRLDLVDDIRTNIIDWIYELQYIPKDEEQIGRSGIQGSSMLNTHLGDGTHLDEYKFGHLAMTYTGIATLLTLGDDLSRLNKKAIIKGVAATQQEDGSFAATLLGNENDMRFVYCAACICYMLDDWTGVDIDKMVAYIKRSIRYDCGISQHEEMESHGGTTYCGVASLELCGRLSEIEEKTIDGMIRWLLFRQIEGFNGRPEKPMDTCYSFWIGATLKILNAFQFTDYEKNREYLMSAQEAALGGFSKWPGIRPDPYHTYFSICGLSFLNENGLQQCMPSLNISIRAYEWMKELHSQWKQS